MKIFVSLPKNDLALAQAALAGGADGIKIHLNAFHRASQTTFGSYTQELPFLRELSKLPIKKFVMAGQETLPTAQELKEMATLGFEAFNCYLKDAKPSLFGNGLRPVLAVDDQWTARDVALICEDPTAWIEASVVPFSGYGAALDASDLANYKTLVRQSNNRFIIVPSQKKILPSDVPAIQATGVGAILLGVIAIGSTPESIREGVLAFRQALGQSAD